MNQAKPVILPLEFPESALDPDAVAATTRLQEAGYTSYIVGGGVRDLLLHRRPKDFDLVSAAEPRTVRQLFRNSRLIGRRFPIVHLYFGPKIVEVACFRRRESPPDGGARPTLEAETAYGTPEDDARARDFTVNALFYDPVRAEVIDHVGGLADIDRGILRTVGDPDVWFQEDPVRILRAAKFAGRLQFQLPAAERAAMRAQAPLLHVCPPSRVTEELFRILESRAAAGSFRVLWETGVLQALIPELHAFLGAPDAPAAAAAEQFRLLALVDRLGPAHDGFSRAFLYTALFFLPAYAELRRVLGARGRPALEGAQAGVAWLSERAGRLQIPRAVRSRQKALLSGLARLTGPAPVSLRTATRFARTTAFGELLMLLRLRYRLTGEGRSVYELLRARADALGVEFGAGAGDWAARRASGRGQRAAAGADSPELCEPRGAPAGRGPRPAEASERRPRRRGRGRRLSGAAPGAAP